jgi:hypothetical protein
MQSMSAEHSSVINMPVYKWFLKAVAEGLSVHAQSGVNKVKITSAGFTT